jgi:hypothetical protein
VGAAVGAFGWAGCAGRVAQEFGDHPETAVIRMRWARGVASGAFEGPVAGRGPGAEASGLLSVGPGARAGQESGLPGAGRGGPARSAGGGG